MVHRRIDKRIHRVCAENKSQDESHRVLWRRPSGGAMWCWGLAGPRPNHRIDSPVQEGSGKGELLRFVPRGTNEVVVQPCRPTLIKMHIYLCGWI